MEITLNNISSNKLKNVNITFLKNEITSILGPHGSGKTHLLNLLYGLEKINSGDIKFYIEDNKADIKIQNEGVSNKNIYYLREDYKNCLFNINIKEDLRFYLGDYDNSKFEELLKSFDLENKILQSNYLDLSSSEKRKILIIIGLMSTSKIIILENPTLNLDVKSIQTLIKHLKKIKREKIIIITSHNCNFLLEVSDKLVIIHNNTITRQGTKFEILSDEKILNKINLNIPEIIHFVKTVKDKKNIKLGYRDNINDLIKDIFRYAK